MYFTDEIRDPSKELPELPDTSELQEREMSMAKLLVESMESTWDPSRYHDTHREGGGTRGVERLGNEIVVGTVERPPTKVVDLMEVLTASIDSVKAGSKSSKVAKRTGTAARSSAPKKSTVARKTDTAEDKTVGAEAPTKISSKPAAKATGRRKAS